MSIALFKDGKLVRMAKNTFDAGGAIISGEADSSHSVTSLEELNKVLKSFEKETEPNEPVLTSMSQLTDYAEMVYAKVLAEGKTLGTQGQEKVGEAVNKAKIFGRQMLEEVRTAIHEATKPK